MKKFRLFATLLVVLCTTTFFTSCRNDDDNNKDFEIRATNVINSNSDIAFVRAMIWSWNWGCDLYLIAGEAPFQNNGFTLSLIDNVPNYFLHRWSNEVFTYNVIVSDANAKFAWWLTFIAYNSDGNQIGYFRLEDIRENEIYHWIEWFYADRNATIRGFYAGRIYDWNFRRGWNVIYNDRNRTTSQRLSGMNLQWYFSGFGDWEEEDWSSHSKITRTIKSRSSIVR